MPSDRRRSIDYSQNFLKSRKLAAHLVQQSGIEMRDTVLEIGPGKGVLTRPLAARCHQVIAVERDPEYANRLRIKLAEVRNVVIYEADFLDFPLPLTPYKVFANIPFNITSEIVSMLTQTANPPEEAHLILQREAAERFTGQPRESLVSMLTKPWFKLFVTHRFKSTDFVPSPRVDVVLLRFNRRGAPLVPKARAQAYRDFVVYGFTAWQPNIRAAFKDILGRREFDAVAARIGLNPELRPSEVQLGQWLKLYGAFENHGTHRQRTLIEGAERRLREQQADLRKSHRTRSRRSR